MSIGDDSDIWSGTVVELGELLVLGYKRKKCSGVKYPSRRVISKLSLNYIKRNKQTINFLRNE